MEKIVGDEARKLIEMDGVDHINCHSKGRTVLGRAVTNFARTRFRTHIGWFTSMEGYWYFCKIWLYCRRERSVAVACAPLRTVWGSRAKTLGKELQERFGVPNEWLPTEIFCSMISIGLHCKLLSNPYLTTLLVKNELPLRHYHVFGTEANPVVQHTPHNDWVWSTLELIVGGMPLPGEEQEDWWRREHLPYVRPQEDETLAKQLTVQLTNLTVR